jgi:hypothetical protein
VVGSLADVSRSAARELVATGTVAHFRVAPEALFKAVLAKLRSPLRRRNGFKSGGDVLIEIMMDGLPDMEIGSQPSQRLADVPATRRARDRRFRRDRRRNRRRAAVALRC